MRINFNIQNTSKILLKSLSIVTMTRHDLGHEFKTLKKNTPSHCIHVLYNAAKTNGHEMFFFNVLSLFNKKQDQRTSFNPFYFGLCYRFMSNFKQST